MEKEFLDRLERSRSDAATAYKLTSAFRCINYNLSVGGKPDSAHRCGRAVDIACTTSYNRFLILNALIRNGFTRIGIASDFIHVDDDPTKPDWVIWTY